MTKKAIEKPKDITYFKLNNMVNIPTENNEIQLIKIKKRLELIF
jgi:hypothetical protein